MSNLSEYYFCVAGNSRLEFECAKDLVEPFVSGRISFFGARCEFSNGWGELEGRVKALLDNPPVGVKYLVIADVMSPFCDPQLVRKMAEVSERTEAPLIGADGAVPGTEVKAVISLSAWTEVAASFSLDMISEAPIVRWETQSIYNNQLNLYKYKRVKQFLALIAKFPELRNLQVKELMEQISRDEEFALITMFGEDIRQIWYEYCPHCDGKLQPLSNTMSQPFCGYLPQDRPMYHECESCSLVVQSPSVHEDDIYKVYDKWDKQDFVASTNNPYTKDSRRCDFGKIEDHLPANVKALDLGGGIGNFSRYLHSMYPDWSITHSDFEIKASAPPGVQSRMLDFTRDPIGREQYNLITAWEVIEHVPYHLLSYTLTNIWEALEPGGFFIFSTPDFDSPLCKSFDFYALCPPFHYLVFGKKWLTKYFLESNQFEIFDTRHCSDFLDDAINWYEYGAKTCPSMATRATSEVLQQIFKLDKDNSLKEKLTRSGLGTEIIMTLRKRINT
jgi:hypothetical protein